MLSLIARANVRVGVRAMPWPEALPFYAAVIAGPGGDATADAANPSRSKPSRIVDAITYIFVLASVGAAFYWLIRPDVMWAFLYAWLCGSVLTQLILARDKGRTLAMNRRAVDHYLESGGRGFFLLDPQIQDPRISAAKLSVLDTGLEEVTKKWGAELDAISSWKGICNCCEGSCGAWTFRRSNTGITPSWIH